jgi:transposase
MSHRTVPLPRDIAGLTRLVLAQEAENEKLKAQLATLKRLIFGARSETLASVSLEQGRLALGDLVEGGTPPDAPVDRTANMDPQGSRRAGARQAADRNIGALPAHLPRCEQVIEPATTVCPCCGGSLHRIGETWSEALDVVPAIVRVKKTIRPKYACRACEGAVVQALAPARVTTGGMASTALVAQVVAWKFAWHLPLNRQSQMFAAQGVELDRGTLGRWVARAAWWLKPVYERLLGFIRSQPRIFSDETRLPRLDPGRGRTKICQLWGQAVDDRPWRGPAPPAVGWVFAESRATAAIEAQLQTFSGILQVDGYRVYETLAKRRRGTNGGAIRLAHCLAHARRKFVEVHATTGSQEALGILGMIGEIYGIEAAVRGGNAERRLEARRQRSLPVMAALRDRLLATRAAISAQSSLARACRYALDRWDGLTAFLSDGRIEVDSNTIERSMKSVALTRKNALFAGNAGGGETWAILASLVETAKLNGLDPQAWLADVLDDVVTGRVKTDRLDTLLPWARTPAGGGAA